MRNFFPRTLIVVILLSGIGPAPLRSNSDRRADEKRPNVILCMTDDQGWGDAGYLGHPVLRTPHLDQMAAEGVRWDRFYAAAPVCSPTRASCLTGRHPHRYGILHANVGHLPAEEQTLAEILKTAGYRTGHFGKWHLGTLTSTVRDSNRGRPGKQEHFSPPWGHGFDRVFSTEAKVPTYWEAGAYAQYGTRYWTGPDRSVPDQLIRGDDSKLIMDEVLPFVRSAVEAEAPFLAVIWFHTPHLPVRAAAPYTDGYREHADYLGSLTAMDEQLGRLRETLRELAIDQQTMLWFCSDNGPEGKETDAGQTGGLRGRKRSLYEGGIRVPGLLVWPDQFPTARRISVPASTLDYLPTVLAATGLRLPDEGAQPLDGINLLPILAGDQATRSRPLPFISRKQFAWIDDPYKLYSPDGGETWELYDLVQDPGESHDLAAAMPGKLAELVADWRVWQGTLPAGTR